MKDDQIKVRTLGMVEVKKKQTAKFLKTKILDVLSIYNVGLKNVFSVTSDNGSNMCAAVRELQRAIAEEHEDENGEMEHWEVLSNVLDEFKDSVSLVRCAVHTMQLAVTDVTKLYEDNIKAVTNIAKACRKISYEAYFEAEGQALPPLYAKTRWGGVFKMVEHFNKFETFYVKLGAIHKELDLDNNWKFVNNFVQAFSPTYEATIKFQDKHVGLSDFHMLWINTIRMTKLIHNPMAEELSKNLLKRLESLKENMPFKAAILLDPRFYYEDSRVFTPDEKEQIRKFIVNTSARISNLKGDTQPENSIFEVASSKDDLDDYLTTLYGGSLPSSNRNSRKNTITEQLSVLDVGTRKEHNFDVWSSWQEKK
ncbi:uncharacterized protein LOC129726108 [Wyeomyia smithii]|uniref:uncharacterized protein LOC129726108 n=1 Tax=Wyeomyia smithii TaxID=174621 RepID=UPI002467C2BC|nr:uncharacterized protein LOC129726108 [Wyeomyia smithii]